MVASGHGARLTLRLTAARRPPRRTELVYPDHRPSSNPTEVDSAAAAIEQVVKLPFAIMSVLTSTGLVSLKDKPLAWLHGEVKTPPFSQAGRLEAGFLPRRPQRSDALTMPQSRPMPSIGPRCHELRINDMSSNWRLIYRIDVNASVIAEVFAKKTPQTPKTVIETCRRRLKEYDHAGK